MGGNFHPGFESLSLRHFKNKARGILLPRALFFDEADQSAAITLIPPEDYKLFAQNNCSYPQGIQSFAERIGISPGIVVGQLQNDGLLNLSCTTGCGGDFINLIQKLDLNIKS